MPDLHKHLEGCDKNPGHQNFVPVDQFNVDHLPPGCRDNDLVDLVRALSDLTVRVDVKYVSDRRPETFPGSDKPYPNYKNRDSDIMRVGTGWVSVVNKYPVKHGKNDTVCDCEECENSPTPKTQFARIHILTAAHVVYDSLEAAHTTCHLFYNNGGTPHACSDVVTLTGFSFVRRSNSDLCEMRHVTHNLDLAEKLEQMLDKRDSLKGNLYMKHYPLDQKTIILSPGMELSNPMDTLTIIVSHPHGCCKQVSFGYCIDKTERGGNSLPATYTTATCPGSAGAYVFLFKRGKKLYFNEDVVHIGSCDGDKNLNFSSEFIPEICKQFPCHNLKLEENGSKDKFPLTQIGCLM